MISEHVDYIGCNDRKTTRFEGLWPLPYGVSYNSYLVKGSEKVAIIDGVEISDSLRQIENIEKILDGRKPDYLVINHMEPDHSGSIRIMKQAWPDLTIVGNPQTVGMITGYYGDCGETLVVKDGATLSLGDVTLRFVTTPMVHWPETMMTILEEEDVLFSGDAFGCYGALNGAVCDLEMDTDRYFPEMVRYYSNIVGKYGQFVQKALKKFEGYVPKAICSTHGPVWKERVEEVIDLYDRLSRYEPLDKGVTIVYGSMYGNTERIIEQLAKGLAEGGVRNIAIHNAAKTELSDILADTFRHRGLVIASPTYSERVFPPVQAFLEAIRTRGLKNRLTLAVGSFTWVAKAGPAIDTTLSELDMAPVAPLMMMKQGGTDADREAAFGLGLTLAAQLNA